MRTFCQLAAPVLSAICLSWSSDILSAAEPDDSRTIPNSLAALNQEFRATYARARADVLRGTDPIVLYDGEKLVLLHDGKRQEGTRLPAVYDQLKAMSHLPFTIYLELRSQTAGPLDDAARSRTANLLKLTEVIEQDLPKYSFAPEDLPRQRRLVEVCRLLLEGVLARKTIDATELDRFAKQTGDDLNANLLAAADVEMAHYHRQLQAWNLPDAAWQKARVVICGSQMPRRDHRVVQLLSAWLNVAGEGKRIVYAEGIYEEQRALNLLATHALDAESATAFFGDDARLDRDLLADGAAKYVREQMAKPLR